MIGRSKKVIFGQLKERIWKRIRVWKEKTLSKGGKEILIKSVAQAIPTYTMSCFKLPVGLCEDIEQQLCKFWWGDGTDKRKIHWMRWKRMCLPKEKGGMGFRDLQMFNKALLARQGCRLIQEPDTLLARMLKARYLPRSSFIQATVGFQPSFTWRSLMTGRDALVQGLRWHVGNGEDVTVFEDPWIPRPTSFKPIGNPWNYSAELKVADLIDWATQSWDEDLVRGVLMPMDADMVLKLRIAEPEVQDELIWHYTQDGNFTVKSCYHMLMEAEQCSKGASTSDPSRTAYLWTKLWHIDVAPRVRNFLWRACKGVLPCLGNLKKRGVVDHDLCLHCGVNEDEGHILFHCTKACAVWKGFPSLRKITRKETGVLDALESLIKLGNQEMLQCWTYVLDIIWSARNKRVFELVDPEPEDLIRMVEQRMID